MENNLKNRKKIEKTSKKGLLFNLDKKLNIRRISDNAMALFIYNNITST